MRIKSVLAGFSAIALAASPVAAAPVDSLSLATSADVRASADQEDASALAGGSATGLIIFAVVVGGLVALLASEDFGEEPDSL